MSNSSVSVCVILILLFLLCKLILTESKSCSTVYLFPNLDTLLGFMFHLGSIQGLISSWDFSITRPRLQAPKHSVFYYGPINSFAIFELENYIKLSASLFQYLKSAMTLSKFLKCVCFIHLKVALNVLSASVYSQKPATVLHSGLKQISL